MLGPYPPILHLQGPRGETQEWPDDDENGKGQIYDEVFDVDIPRIVNEVSEERIGNVVHPDCPQQPPPSLTEQLLQISDRQKC